MKRVYLLIVFIILSNISIGQNLNLNQYKYAIVESKFDFVRQVDGYQTSSFTKFLFNKTGFITYLDNEELPEDLAMNKCLAFFVSVTDDSGMLTTRNNIELKDCRGNLLFLSNKGESRLKDYTKAYRQTIRTAFTSIKKINYSYDSSIKKNSIVKEKVLVPVDKDDKPLKLLKEAKVNKEIKKVELPLLYAQKNDAGYQLIDTKPSVVFILLKTNDLSKYIIKDKNGTLINKGDYWLAEYYKDGNLVTEKYLIKF